MMPDESLRDRVKGILRNVPGGSWLVDRYATGRPDAWVISYPKSGRTWLRLALGTALVEHFRVVVPRPADVLELNRLARLDGRIPNVQFTHENDAHLQPVTKLDRTKAPYRGQRVIFLSRDPRDVVVSHYFQQTKRARILEEGDGFDGTLSAFLRDGVFGISSIVAFMNSWAEARSVPESFLLVRYEDMSQDMSRELVRVLGFLGLGDMLPDTMAHAVADSSFDRMRDFERAGTLGRRLRATDPTDPESSKVRKGKVGGFREYLSADDQRYADDVLLALAPVFGYTAAP